MLDRRIQRVVVQQNRAKNRTLRVQIVREWFFERRVNGHRSFALLSPCIRLFYHRLRRRASAEFLLSSCENSLPLSDVALCVEVAQASIGEPVHRLGNLCKTFRAKKVGASAAGDAPTEQTY